MASDDYVHVQTPYHNPNDNPRLFFAGEDSNGVGQAAVVQVHEVPSPLPAPTPVPAPAPAQVATADIGAVVKWLASLEEERQQAASESAIRKAKKGSFRKVFQRWRSYTQRLLQEKENATRLIQYCWRNHMQCKQRHFREKVKISISSINESIHRICGMMNGVRETVSSLSRDVAAHQQMIQQNRQAIATLQREINRINGYLAWRTETQNLFDPRKMYRAIRTDGGSEPGTAYNACAVQTHCLLFEFSGSGKGRIDHTNKGKMRHVVDGTLPEPSSTMSTSQLRGAVGHYDVTVEYLHLAH